MLLTSNCIFAYRTALHWACKRGHHNIVNILLKVGADAAIHSVKGETCAQVATDPLIKQRLGGK